ncbi:MAG: 16S rRNA (uracil(1498)-N(3))-methyltransferase [Clostridiales bacterium]|nr:16S rRNA (uracil(1498)-N(3))-methyltransferase [Clostridiales bacterium]
MNRFFIEADKIKDSYGEIVGEDAIHILRVLRLDVGDLIEICDGAGRDYPATIIETNKGWVKVKLGEGSPSKGEPLSKVTLYQGIPKSTKMDLVIQKCVELGVYEIVPLETARTITDLSEPKKANKKVARWQKIAHEAAKQSKRGIIPSVDMPMTFSQAIKTASHSTKIIFWEGEREVDLKKYLDEKNINHHNNEKDIGIIIGPEGGLNDQEVALAKEYGWDTITLGPRILRTETAGMAALAAIMFYTEEMK